ncbi:phage terminase large subunit family protein [Caulobacter sp. RL271]|uniref:Phage terminase large subunit family protein n=1 Tax=Caulobacter segnis TaxID=88688 RepID=A0ABY4ZWN8_9CAUL|nr:terminase gpA endonuclease subunit [Caulobacter segnis]USQ97253.1 phage terminase large subunit family protein [Caulobacter segnis]
MCIHLTNAERLAMETSAEAWDPPPAVDYLSWAKRNIVFSERESPERGPYNEDRFPLNSEILKALGPDDPCRIVTFAKSAQLGGTVLANIFTLGSLDMDPGDFLYVHPTDDNARRWSKMKLMPMLKGTTAIARLFPTKSRDGGDSVLYKERIDGRGALQISGANSPASLSQVTMKRQCQDDLAKWEMNAGGDPETQADSRSAAHMFAKIFKISTPLIWPGCRITKSFRAGSQEVPELPCPHCQHYQVLTWDNMLANLDEAKPEAACFSCVSCGGLIEEHHRPWMLKRHRFVAGNPKAMRYHRSFWWWAAYSVLQSWEGIARAWLTAKGDPAREQTFMNDMAGLAYEAAGEAVAWEVLRDRAAQSHYRRGQVPAGGLVITIGVDCQKDYVQWQVVAWGREVRRWVVERGVFPGHISEPSCQALLDDLVKQLWINSAGRGLGCDLLAIDGNAWTEDVWGWAKKHPAHRVIMVRGANTETAPLIARVKKEVNAKTGKKLKYSRRFFNFGASVLKMGLYRLLNKTDPLERGYVGFPVGLEDDYFQQLTSERRKAKKNKQGFEVWTWIKDATQANEDLDTMNQAETAAIKLGVRSFTDTHWDRLEAEREAPIKGLQLDLEDLMNAAAPPASEAPTGAADELAANAVRDDAPEDEPPPPAKPPAPAPAARPSLRDLGRRLNRR